MSDHTTSNRVAFVVPHSSGCKDTTTGEVYESMKQVRAAADRVDFRLVE